MLMNWLFLRFSTEFSGDFVGKRRVPGGGRQI
jgi:hypothetical protein